MICEAILKIKSDAQVSVSGKDIDTCTITWHDGNPTNITKDQIKAKIAELPTAEEEATAKANNKTSGHNKLKALGLTDAEIEAL
jgi:hypothetical protein